MFGAQYFGQVIFAAAAIIATPSGSVGTAGGGLGSAYFGQYVPQSFPATEAGTDGGGFGSCYFGQYAPGTSEAPPTPSAGTDGGGFGSAYFGQYAPGASEGPTPPSAGTYGAGFGAQYFGQYWPGTSEAPPPPAPAGTDGGGLGSVYFGQYWPGAISGPQGQLQSSGGFFPLRNRILIYKAVTGKGSGIIGPLDGEAVGRVANPISAEARGTVSALALSAAPEVTPYDFTEQGQQDLASILLSL